MNRASKTHFLSGSILLFIAFGISQCNPANRVVSYPPITDLTMSDVYEIQVNGKNIWVEKFRTDMEIEALPDWFTSTPYTSVQQELHITNFSCKGTIRIEIKVTEPVRTVYIHPYSRKIIPEVAGDKVSIRLPGPDKLFIEVNDLPPLCLFANPMEDFIPDPSDRAIRYFGPGVHRPGMMNLEDNELVYLAGGAVVYGGIRTNGASTRRRASRRPT